MVGCTLVYGLSVSFLLSTILCINATLKADPVTDTCGYAPDVVHPFTHRKITRTRQNVVAKFAEYNDTCQVPCTRDVSTCFVGKTISRGENPCKCPEVVKNHSISFGRACCHNWRNISKVMLDFLDKGNPLTSKNTKSSNQSWQTLRNELKYDKVLEKPDLFGISIPDDIPTKNCKPGNHLLFEGFLNIIRHTNNTKTRKVVYHETLFPLGKFPTIGHGFFFDKAISFTNFGSQ